MANLWTCRKCRALLEPGTRSCPYCETDQRHHAAPSESQDAEATQRLGIWILLVNVLLFILMVSVDPAQGDRRSERFVPSGQALEMFGSTSQTLVRHCGQYWRFLTAIFLHIDLAHLLMNCFALLIITPLAAGTLGVHRTWCIYVAAGMLGNVVSHWQGNAGAGASGALCGMVGALGIYGWRRGGAEGQVLTRRMLGWAVLILVFGYVVDGIDNAAHGGGLGAGGLVGWFAAGVRARGSFVDRAWIHGARAATVGVALVGVLLFAPNVVRGFERREALLFRSEVNRRLGQIEAVARGDAPPASLRATVGAGPSGSDEVRAALRRALTATRQGDPERAQAHAAAVEAFARWRSTLLCRYGLR